MNRNIPFGHLLTVFELSEPGPSSHIGRFRQYGLWERYSEIYRNEDLIYDVDVNDYRKDWFFAQVTRLYMYLLRIVFKGLIK